MAVRSAQVMLCIEGSEDVEVGISRVVYNPKVELALSYEPGNDATTKVDLIGSARVEMTGSPIDFDLRGGGLLDGTGAGIDPDAAVEVVLVAHGDNDDPITVDSTGVNGWVEAFDGVLKIKPGGHHALGAPAGYAVAAGTGDRVALDGTAGDRLDILVIARSETSSS